MTFRARLFWGTSLALVFVLAAVTVFAVYRVMNLESDRLDRRLCMEARRLADIHERRPDVSGMERDLIGKLQVSRVDQLVFQADSASGISIQSASMSQWSSAAITWKSGRKAADTQHQCRFAEVRTAEGAWQMAHYGDAQGAALVGANVSATRQVMRSVLSETLWQALPFALLMIGAAASVMAGVGVRPLNRLRESMRTLGSRDLGRRLSVHGEDREFSELIESYNHMLARLESSFQQAARFSSNAAHELKTPLTILRGRLEQMLSHPDDQQREEHLGMMLDEISRLTAITRKLLLLSRADAGQLALNRKAMNLGPVLQQLGDDLRMLGGGREVEVLLDGDMPVFVDEVLITLLLNNLMSNALRYTPDDGWIRLSAALHANAVQIRLANSCEPMSSDVRVRLFERFYRADASHGRRVDGHGLGLSLAREVALAHGGDLQLEETGAEEVRFCLSIPLNRTA